MLDNITGFYYTRNDDGNNGNREERKRRIGVSAQDIKEVVPEAVEADENGLLDNFDFAVKKSIDMTSTIEPVSIGSNEKKTFRATDSFQITGPFQVDSGGEMTVIMQSCPE